MDANVTETAAVAELAQRAAGMQLLDVSDGTPIVFVPHGFTVRELTHLRDLPARAEGTYIAHDRVSFVTMLNELRHPERRPRVYVDKAKRFIVAVLDEVQASGPAWRRLRVIWTIGRSVPWAAWVAVFGRYLKQRPFAEFLDDWRHIIVRPAGADMLELAQHMEGTKSADFKSAQRLKDGSVQFGWSEEVRATMKEGLLEVPGEVVIRTAIFHGEDAVEIPLRFRWMIDEGKLGFMLVPPPIEDLEQSAIDYIIALMQQDLVSDTIVEGIPPA